jgi:hypothetical protein
VYDVEPLAKKVTKLREGVVRIGATRGKHHLMQSVVVPLLEVGTEAEERDIPMGAKTGRTSK